MSTRKSAGNGSFVRWLLATSSSVAFGAAAGNQAQAFPCTVQNTGSAPGISVTNTLISGNVCNTGTLSPGGITVTNSTINGFIFSSGSIAGGISVDGNSQVNAGLLSPWAISVTGSGSTFSGGILNSGSLSSGGSTINVDSLSSFSGGIVNGGTINAVLAGTTSSNVTGVNVSDVASFSGGTGASSGISNGGTITAIANVTGSNCGSASAFGVNVVDVSTFSGGISNGGTIAATATTMGCSSAVASAAGIVALGFSTFSGGINNGGTITAAATASVLDCAQANANAAGIVVQGVGSFSDGIINSGAITATATIAAATGNGGQGLACALGILVQGIGSFSGGIANRNAISATATTSSFSCANAIAFGINVEGISGFSGGISNGGTIKASATATSTDLFSCARANAYGINVTGVSMFSDGISNGGTILATASATAGSAGASAGATAIGINVTFVSAFSGGISNGGTIKATATVNASCAFALAYGIRVDRVSSLSGGISNRGTITANANALSCGNARAYGVSVTNVSLFSGDINNGGTITATGGTAVGIFVDNVSTFAGRIINSGTITGDIGILVGASTPGISIFSSGTITGNCGTAIRILNAGGNTLTLAPGFVMNGRVVAQNGSNTLQLGGTGNGSFNLSTLGDPLGYLGFDTFNTISGTWTATGIYGHGLTSAWNVTGGTFLVDGDLSAATGLNVTGATLGGTGFLPTTTINSGSTLMPGLSSTPGGQLTVSTGNLTMNSGSLYLVNVGTTPGFASATQITNGGAAFLNPGSLIQAAGSGAFTAGAQYTVLTANGGVNSTFSNTIAGRLGSMSAKVTYDANDVFLNLVPLSMLSFLPPGSSTNVIDVASGLTAANVGTPAIQFQNLFSLSPQQLQTALVQLSGEVGTGTQESGLQLMNSFISLLSNPFSADHGGVGPVMPFAPEHEMFTPEIADAYASAMHTKAPILKAAAAAEPHYSYWGGGYGGANSTSGDPAGVGSHDVNTQAIGFAGGVDIRTAPGQVVGFSLGGANTSWGLSSSLGTGRSDAFQAGVYGSQQWGPAYLSGVLAYSNFWATTDRTVNVAGADRLIASFDAQGLGGRVEGGYRVSAMPVGVTPYAAVQAQYFHTPNYSETALSGSAQFALSYSAKDQTVMRTELGSWFDQTVQLQQTDKLALFARAAWAHDFNNTSSLMTTFLALPAASFVVNGAKPPADLALTTAGAELRVTNGISVMGRFDGEFGKGSQTYTGTGRVRYQW